MFNVIKSGTNRLDIELSGKLDAVVKIMGSASNTATSEASSA